MLNRLHLSLSLLLLWLQIMVTKEVAESVGGLKKLVPTGTSVLIEGTLAQTPEGTKQVTHGPSSTQRSTALRGSGKRSCSSTLQS